MQQVNVNLLKPKKFRFITIFWRKQKKHIMLFPYVYNTLQNLKLNVFKNKFVFKTKIGSK